MYHYTRNQKKKCTVNPERQPKTQLDPELPEAKAMKEWYEGAKAKGGDAASFKVCVRERECVCVCDCVCVREGECVCVRV